MTSVLDSGYSINYKIKANKWCSLITQVKGEQVSDTRQLSVSGQEIYPEKDMRTTGR